MSSRVYQVKHRDTRLVNHSNISTFEIDEIAINEDGRQCAIRLQAEGEFSRTERQVLDACS